ncbi:DUF3231 family protein [Salipaludibacillus sp. HK11]|uniref:DUF3231 family protein n=1 Tax=Salipaludibacillus sp. HK11 TaxID=3394320 RepID=UPI0039FBCE7F
MNAEEVIKLSSAEISHLWTTYMNDSGGICHLVHELNIVEDEEIKTLLQDVLNISQSHIEKLIEIFNKENFPIPHGFKLDEDVDVDAPRLFSDEYALNSVNEFGRMGLNAYSVALSTALREDVYTFFSNCLSESDEIIKKSNELLLAKGLYVKSPNLSIPENIDYVEDKSFLAGFFTDKRPLISTEITNLYTNFKRNALGAATMIGYSQVAENKDVVDYIVKGKKIAEKHCEIFGDLLKDNDLPCPTMLGAEVTDSTSYTFSDRKMMYYTTVLIAVSIGYYGSSLAMSPRRDIGLMYTRLSVEIMKYADEGARILIKHGWMEEPPRSLDRDELVKK